METSSDQAEQTRNFRVQRTITFRLQATLLLAWVLLGIASLLTWRNFTVDDAFIGWRHGLNLVEHGRYSFNSTGERVDAATSPAYAFISAIPTLLGIDVVLFFKLFAALTALATVTIIWKRLASDQMVRMTLIAMISCGPIQAIHLWSGLETYAFFSLALVIGLATLGQLKLSRTAFQVLAVLLVCTRLEGIAFILGATFSRFIFGLDKRDISRGSIMRSFRATFPIWTAPTIALLVITTMRQFYFSSPIPNTLGTKTLSGSIPEVLTRIQGNLRGFSISVLLLFAISLLLSKPSRLRFITFAVPTYSTIAFVYLPSNLSMNYADRFVFQNFWPIIISGLALVRLNGLKRLALSAATLAALTLNTPMSEARDLIDYYPRMTSAMLGIGESLRYSSTIQGTLIIGDAGLAPYASTWFSIDTNFLGTDRKFGSEGVIRTIERGRSTVLALYASGDELAEIRDQDLPYQVAAEGAGYKFLGSIEWRNNYWFQMWVSSDLTRDEILIRSLERVIRISMEENGKSRFKDSLISWYWRF